jgi:membrane fusion protein
VDEAPFLRRDPPPAVARGLSTLVLVLFAVAAIAATTVRFSETVSAPFALVPVRGTDPVRAPRKGSVAQALAVLGRPVARGALLFEINSPELSDRTAEKETLDSTVTGAADSVANALTRHESETRLAQKEMASQAQRVSSLDRAVTLQQEQLFLLEEQLERFRKLTAQGLTSMNERADAQIRHAQAKLATEQLDAARQEAVSALHRLRDAEAARRSRFREEERALVEKMEHAAIRASALSGEAGTGQGAGLSVHAPCDGTVIGVKVRSVGAVVLEGDVLAEIACAGEALQAELDVPQAGLSRIQPDQSVRLLLEALPYQRYGAQEGRVRWTSPAGTGGAGATFAVLVELDEHARGAHGARTSLVAGMRGTARVVVGRRTLLAHALEPLQALRENLR